MRWSFSLEKAYSMAEMFPWQASERTKIPAYDKAFNDLISPVLEKKTDFLIRSKQFEDATLTGKRAMLKKLVSDAKADVRKLMKEGYLGGDNQRLRMASKASNVPRGIQREAAEMMRQQYGVDGKLKDFSIAELDMFLDIADYLKDIYDVTDSM